MNTSIKIFNNKLKHYYCIENKYIKQHEHIDKNIQ
jgi:hypothetical protein